MTNDRKLQLSCYLITIACIIVMLLRILQPGMSEDGALYAGIARNMAHGIGNIWHPKFFPGRFPSFYEHPPFAIWLQSLFFRIMGDGYLVERIYFICTTTVNITLAAYLWRKTFKNSIAKSMIWIPIILWMIFPHNIEIASGGYLENTATIFSTMAVCFLIEQRFLFKKNRIISIFFAAACIFLGFLSNGPVLLFPLTIPFWQYLIYRNCKWQKMILETSMLLSFLISFFLILFVFSPQALVNIKEFIFTQVLPSTIGNRFNLNHSGIHRLYILYIIFISICPFIILSCFALKYKSNIIAAFDTNKLKRNFVFFFAIAISASVPIVLSHRGQFRHYFFPSLLFYMVAFSQIITPIITIWLESNVRKNFIRTFNIIATIILIISMSFFVIFINTTKTRHAAILNDVNVIGSYLKHKLKPTLIEKPHFITTDVTNGNEYLQIFFGRFYQIDVSLKGEKQTDAKYYLTYKGQEKAYGEYKKITLNTKLYDLYRHQ